MKTLKNINSIDPLFTGWRHPALLPLLLLSLLAAAAGRGQAPIIPEDVKATITAQVTNGFTPAIVVGVVNSNGSAFFSCGVRDLDTGDSVSEDSVFEIGEITATFTATILSQLLLDGSLVLTNPAQSYLPEGVQVPSHNGKSITLEHLATHYSGLPSHPTNLNPADPLNPYADYSVQQMYDFLSSYQLLRDPGAACTYSRFNLGLVGQILQLKTGSDYETLITERITRPLGMTNTGVRLSPGMASHLATGYNGVVRMPAWDFTPALAGAASLRASPRDLLRFVAANMGLVPTGLYAAMTNAHTPIRPFDAASSIGLAWDSIPLQNDRATYLYSQIYGYCAFVGFLESKKLGVVVLTSCGCVKSIACLGEHLLDPTVPLPTVPTPPAVGIDTLRHCVGRFQASGGKYFDIGIQYGHLTYAYSEEAGIPYTLYPSAPYYYFPIDVNATVTFHTNSLGQVVNLLWTQGSQSTTLSRVALPSRLDLQRVRAENQIAFTGDTDVNYVLEATSDLAHWQPISTNTIWTQPIVDANPGASRFYRLRRP